MEPLREIYEKRKKYFKNLDEYFERIKSTVAKEAADAEIYLFGSVVEGKFSVGLSDIDIAIVSNEFVDRERKLDVFGKLIREFFDSPFEFHVLTKEQWNLYKNFIRNFRKI